MPCSRICVITSGSAATNGESASGGIAPRTPEPFGWWQVAQLAWNSSSPFPRATARPAVAPGTRRSARSTGPSPPDSTALNSITEPQIPSATAIQITGNGTGLLSS